MGELSQNAPVQTSPNARPSIAGSGFETGKARPMDAVRVSEQSSDTLVQAPADIELRDYQKECIELVDSLEGGSHIVQMPTGAGKTATYTHIPRHGRVLVLSHRDELVRQPLRFYEMQGVEVGIEKAGEHSHGEEVVSASVQTLRPKRLHESFKPGEFDMIITDECHHAAAPSYRAIYDYLQPRLHIGFTATPARNDDLALSDVFDDVVFSRDLEWGITKGWLCDLDCAIVDIDWDLSHVKCRYGDFQANDLAREVNTAHYNDQIVEAYRTRHVGPTMIFASSVGHAHALAERIPRSAVISGKTKQAERNQILADFRAGAVECVVNCMVLTEGTDLPFVETIMLARPTKSVTLYIQMVGRGLRPCPETGKERCLLLDCEGVSEKMDICSPADLLGVDTKGFGGEVEQGPLSEMRQRVDDREDSPEGWLLRLRRVDPFHRGGYNISWSGRADGSRYLKRGPIHLEVSAPDQVGKVELDGWDKTRGAHSHAVCRDMAYADRLAYSWLLSNECAHESRRLWDMHLVEQWGQAPASPKQMELLRAKSASCNLACPEGLTKYEASQLIDNFSERYRELRQRANMRS